MKLSRLQLPGLFVTGTNTDVGKTWVTAAIAQCLSNEGLKVGVIKPAATGLTDLFSPNSDPMILLKMAGWPITKEMLQLACPITFEAAAAPTVAARAEGRRLEWAELYQAVQTSIQGWIDLNVDCILMEGVGGLHCPMAEGGKTVLSLIESLDWPVVVVGRRGLGTLSHTMGTVNALRQGPTRVAGVILNHVPGDNADGIPESTAALELSSHIAPVALLHDGQGLSDSPEELAIDLKQIGWASRIARPRWVD